MQDKLKSLLQPITENTGITFEFHHCATKGTIATIYANEPAADFQEPSANDEIIQHILSADSGRIARADLYKLEKQAWDKYRKRVKISDVDFDNQTLNVKLEDSYHVSDYACNYIDSASDIVADYCKENNIQINDADTELESVCEKIRNNGGDFNELTDAARPEFIYTYELMRFMAENHASIDLDLILQQSGDFVDACRWECASVITSEVSDDDLLESIKEKFNKKDK